MMQLPVLRVYLRLLISVLFIQWQLSALKQPGMVRMRDPNLGNLLSRAMSDDSATNAAASAAYDFMQSQGEWYAMSGCSVLLPPERTPKSIIHFVGGFVAGSAVTIAYGNMLSALANDGHLIVATPIPAINLNHGSVAAGITTAFANCYQSSIVPLLGKVAADVPIFGLSHSLGGKLVVLMNSNKQDRKKLPTRVGNIFLAFNNYGVQDNIDLGKIQAAKASPEVQKIFEAFDRPEVQKLIQTAKDNSMISDAFSNFFREKSSPSASPSGNGGSSTKRGATSVADMLSSAMTTLGDQIGIDIAQKVAEVTDGTSTLLEFEPSPEETWQLLNDGYNIQKNILISFDDDEIDQSSELAMALRRRGCDAKIKKSPGNHVTPNVLVAGVGGDTASVGFLRDLLSLMNDMSDEAWMEVDRKRNEKFMLPTIVKN